MGKMNKLKVKNTNRFNLNYTRYKNFALDVYRWENLPNGIESRYIESQLYEYGQAFFYKNKALGYVCLPCYENNMMDIYGDYSSAMVISANGLVNEQVNFKNGVRILNNDSFEPTKPYILEYASRMTDVENAIEQNVRQQKFPYFIPCNKKTELSLKTMFNKVENGEQAIFGSDMLDVDSFQVLNTNSPYVVDRLNEYRFELEREVLTYLSINNNFEKSERLLTDEVNSNNEYILRNGDIGYKQRLKACELINEYLRKDGYTGKEVTCRKVSDIIKEENDVDNINKLPIIDKETSNEDDTTNDKSIINTLKKLLGLGGD